MEFYSEIYANPEEFSYSQPNKNAHIPVYNSPTSLNSNNYKKPYNLINFLENCNNFSRLNTEEDYNPLDFDPEMQKAIYESKFK